MRGLTYRNVAAHPSANYRRALLQGGVLASMSMVFGIPSALAASPRRIVSIGGALTEIVFALQGASDLVGVDTTSIFPESAQKLPSVGYARSLSVEGVLALAPTQVIATEDAGPPFVIRQLQASGIPVAVLAANHRYEGLVERVKRVGELTGRATQANALLQTLRQEWERARIQVSQRDSKPVRVLFVLAHTSNQIMVAGRETSAQAMMEYANASNAVTAISGYKPLTPESVIAAQPDVVLVTDQGANANGGLESLLKLPGVAQTPAGRAQRFISMEAMFLLGFGPRLPVAVSVLDAAIAKAMRT